MKNVKLLLLAAVLMLVVGQASAQRIVLQAEDGRRSSGTVDTEYTGFTGTGYVNTANAAGEYLEWEFSVKTGANDTLFVVYAHNKSDNRVAKISVNGDSVGTMNFPSTGSWTAWSTPFALVPLRAGMNLVRLTSLTTGGLANTDRIEIGAEPGGVQYKVEMAVSGKGKVTFSPAAPYYDAGSSVTLTAVPNAGALFLGWGGDLNGTTNPLIITVNANMKATAAFKSTVHSTIYLSPAGNDSTGDGSATSPYYSLAKGVVVADQGDTIIMRGGTYYYAATVLIDKKGSSGEWFHVRAYPGERPVLNYSRWVPANETERGSARGIKITGAYWKLTDLEIAYAPDNGVKSEGAHITFDRCIFHHNGDGGLQIGLNKDTYSSNPDPENMASYNYVLNCDSYRNADPGTDYENADGFSCKLYAGVGNYFYGCRAWENCDDGWDCYQTNYEIVIENCWTWHNGDPAQWGFTSFNGDGNGFKLGGNGEPCPITIKNCVAFDSPFGAQSGFNDNNNGHTINVLNCLAWACGRDYNMQDLAHVLKNCGSFNNTRQAPADINSSAVQATNSWNTSGVTIDASDFVSIALAEAIAPREADGGLPRNGFATLKSGSDLIDKGTDVGLAFTGSKPDIGAYEFGIQLPAYPASLTEVREAAASVPVIHALISNYPNPFNPATVISYQLPAGPAGRSAVSHVTLKIFDMLGREVATLVSEHQRPGLHLVTWNASMQPSGIYLAVLTTATGRAAQRMVLIR